MVLIVGFTGRTSYSLVRYLLQKTNKEVIISDLKKTPQQEQLLQELSNIGKVHDELGCQDPKLLDKYPITKIFLSPGVPRAIPLIQLALSRDIQVLNDIEYFYQEFPNRRYIAITGTDGKSTVCSWLHHVLQAEHQAVLCGNIGTPIFEYADETYKDAWYVVELSSFQIESLHSFQPFIAGITNIHKDHLDRYPSFEDYKETKLSLFKTLKKRNYIIVNADDLNLLNDMKQCDALINSFSLFDSSNDAYLKNGVIYLHGTSLLHESELPLRGTHNIQNAMTVMLCVTILGMDYDKMVQALCSFKGVPHRLQKVLSKNGVDYYNDSKATTPEAMRLALCSFDKNVLLLAGGQSKELDFSSLEDIVYQKCKKIYLFGEMAESLAKDWNLAPQKKYRTMAEAVEQAKKDAEDGDVVLLSPGGTSWDEFSSFEERGNNFIEIIKNN